MLYLVGCCDSYFKPQHSGSRGRRVSEASLVFTVCSSQGYVDPLKNKLKQQN